MLDLNSCCVNTSTKKPSENEKFFLYKGNLYIIDSDIIIKPFQYYIDENGKTYGFKERIIGEHLWLDIPADTICYQKIGYAVEKNGYKVIDAFENKEDAENLIKAIYNSIKGES
jgi:hypothetical protein